MITPERALELANKHEPIDPYKDGVCLASNSDMRELAYIAKRYAETLAAPEIVNEREACIMINRGHALIVKPGEPS